KYAFEWKEKYGDIIYSQIAKLGCSVDWDRVTFTMNDDYYAAVIKVFIDLYKKGLIYRGARMINWDVEAKTALSDEEVEYRDVTSKLYYVKYKLEDSDDYISIATQRPETIMGDTGVCVNPTDKRYNHLIGRKVIVPLINKAVPIVADDYIDKDFGTGVLKITPAHDINDYNIGLKHNLPLIDILNDDGTLSEQASILIGEERFAARKKIIELLKEADLLIKEQSYNSRLGYSQRTNSVVEPKISTQWFVNMKALAQPALEAVLSGEINIHPGEKFLATYKYWLENVKDWCISRQLWWGQQIPAWYDADGKFVVAQDEEKAKELFEAQYSVANAELKQDEDVLDTWFSSWLWPIQVFKGITAPGNDDINYYYPTSVLVTGQDIIFFWVSRMIMAGMEFKNIKPFSDVYFTGMVRDKQGRKMSKQLGNSPDLLELIDKYGADAVRFGIMISSPAGNDLLFDEASLEQGRNFNNKLWNALKLVKIWQDKSGIKGADEKNTGNDFAISWFDERLKEVKANIAVLIDQFKLSEALKQLYSLIWDDFCSWYLEWIKPGFNQSLSKQKIEKTLYFFEELMQLLHPFMPFITEEIYHQLKERNNDLTIKQVSLTHAGNKTILTQGNVLKQAITAIRDVRNKNQLKFADKIDLAIQTNDKDLYKEVNIILRKQVNAESLRFDDASNGIAVVINTDKIFVETTTKIDQSVQKLKLLKDLEHLKSFIISLEKKLDNDKFVANAKPEVLELELKKKNDTQAKIAAIQESLQQIEGGI
ncbi:MAG: valine--tRNA ligase, partial [Ginsengibacter sp.]